MKCVFKSFAILPSEFSFRIILLFVITGGFLKKFYIGVLFLLYMLPKSFPILGLAFSLLDDTLDEKRSLSSTVCSPELYSTAPLLPSGVECLQLDAHQIKVQESGQKETTYVSNNSSLSNMNFQIITFQN